MHKREEKCRMKKWGTKKKNSNNTMRQTQTVFLQIDEESEN